MPDDELSTHPKAIWVSVWRYAISFLVGIIVASFTVGSARQKVKDILAWKDEIAPKIERMDSVGTLSFEHFNKTYEKEQKRTEDRLRELEKDMRELQKKVDP